MIILFSRHFYEIEFFKFLNAVDSVHTAGTHPQEPGPLKDTYAMIIKTLRDEEAWKLKLGGEESLFFSRIVLINMTEYFTNLILFLC